MTLSNISTPYDVFTDTAGQIVSSGSIFIGVANQDPETNPITCYWDIAGTIVASQPLNVVNGYIVNEGTPAQVFVNSDYSIRLYSNTSIVFTFLNILAKSLSGTAGGVLTGTYPNPGLANVAVTTAAIADNAVTNAKLSIGGDGTIKATIGTAVVDINAFTLNGILGRVGVEEEFTHANFDNTLYVWANGQALNRVTDVRLYNKISSLIGTQGALGWGAGDGTTTFTVPDYRGRFSRAYSDVGGIDPDAPSRVLGSDQLDEFQDHEHTYTLPKAGGGANTPIISDGEASSQESHNTIAIVAGSGGTPRLGTETRPRNYTHYICIVR